MRCIFDFNINYGRAHLELTGCNESIVFPCYKSAQLCGKIVISVTLPLTNINCDDCGKIIQI